MTEVSNRRIHISNKDNIRVHAALPNTVLFSNSNSIAVSGIVFARAQRHRLNEVPPKSSAAVIVALFSVLYLMFYHFLIQLCYQYIVCYVPYRDK